MIDEVEIGQRRKSVKRSRLIAEPCARRVGIGIVGRTVLFDVLVAQANIDDRLAAKQCFTCTLLCECRFARCAESCERDRKKRNPRTIQCHSSIVPCFAAMPAGEQKNTWPRIAI